MKKITELTEEQKSRFDEWVTKWVDIGLRTGPIDKPTFDKYMPICYQKAGLQYPSRVVHVPSPFYGAFVAAVAAAIWNKRYASASASVSASVLASVRDSASASVRDSVSASVSASVLASVRASVEASVDDSVSASVEASVLASVDASVDDSVGASVGYEKIIISTIKKIAQKYKVKFSWNYWLGGQFWVGGWYGSPAFVSFFTDVCDLELEQDVKERAEAYRKVCESVNYIWPNRDFILVCARPIHIDRDDKGRLHSTERKAIEYPDGWGLYMIHGVRFSEEEFLKFKNRETTALDIMNEKNQDKKRVMAMEYGNERLIKELNAKVCSEELDLQGNPMRIYSIPMEGENLVIYEGVCPSKGEKIYLRVPPEFENQSPWRAKCWTFPELWNIAEKLTEQPELLVET